MDPLTRLWSFLKQVDAALGGGWSEARMRAFLEDIFRRLFRSR